MRVILVEIISSRGITEQNGLQCDPNGFSAGHLDKRSSKYQVKDHWFAPHLDRTGTNLLH